MKWLNDKDSVTQEGLEKNHKAAYGAAAYAAYTAYADAAAAAAAAYAAYDADAAAEKWVNKYFERSGENKQDYIDALNGVVKTISDDKVVFGLMFHGCQTINALQAAEILKAIKAGKIHGVKFTGEK